MTRRRPTTLVLAALLVAGAAACSGDDDGPEVTGRNTTAAPPSSTSTTTGSTTSSSAPPPPTSSSTTSPPVESTTTALSPTSTKPDESDWRAIVETLRRRRQDLYAAPDPGRVGEVCAPQSSCEAGLTSQLSDFVSRGERVVGDPPVVIVSAEAVSMDGPTAAESVSATIRAVEVAQDHSDHRIVDSQGETVLEITTEHAAGTEFEVVLVLGRTGPPGDPWRIVEVL